MQIGGKKNDSGAAWFFCMPWAGCGQFLFLCLLFLVVELEPRPDGCQSSSLLLSCRPSQPCFAFFQTWSQSAAQAGLTLQRLLSQPPEKLESTHVPPLGSLLVTLGAYTALYCNSNIDLKRGRKEGRKERERQKERVPTRC